MCDAHAATLARARDLANRLPDALAEAAASEPLHTLRSARPARLRDRVAEHAGRCRMPLERHTAHPGD